MEDSEKIKLGTSDDLQLYFDGGNSVLDSNTGNLYIQSANNLFIQGANNENIFKYSANGSVEAYYDDVKKLETTSSGITVTSSSGVNPTLELRNGGISIHNEAN